MPGGSRIVHSHSLGDRNPTSNANISNVPNYSTNYSTNYVTQSRPYVNSVVGNATIYGGAQPTIIRTSSMTTGQVNPNLGYHPQVHQISTQTQCNPTTVCNSSGNSTVGVGTGVG